MILPCSSHPRSKVQPILKASEPVSVVSGSLNGILSEADMETLLKRDWPQPVAAPKVLDIQRELGIKHNRNVNPFRGLSDRQRARLFLRTRS
jgi:hypothetical protein